MVVTEVGCLGIKPGLEVMNDSKPEGAVLAKAYTTVTATDGGPYRSFWGLEIENPLMLWAFFDFDSVEHHRRFAELHGAEIVKGLPTLLTHGEFTKHIAFTSSAPVALRSPITQIILIHVRGNVDCSVKEGLSATLEATLSTTFVAHAGVTATSYGLFCLAAAIPRLEGYESLSDAEVAELSQDVAQAVHDNIKLPLLSISAMTSTTGSPRNEATLAVRQKLSLRDPQPPGNFPGSALPFSEQERKCHNEDDFRGHAEIRSGKQHDGAVAFCKSSKGMATLTKAVNGNPPYPAVRYRHVDRWKINHDFKVEWEPGCETSERIQEIQQPTGPGGPVCYHLMRANYLNCINGGVGGSVQVGCLIYTYNGGKAGQYY
ncbi:hypothetical protein CkaCkLH20_04343 [Colletotrichum karsti]|uniref:Uncharacterized protein n=1 Tax=Colletotrichum karsti TaxID=1095194 RepID=A0A9P6IGD9_9PEZI|nr:uncharacterized protein CkaCkLH20_04343 [Colletotrichum karsti]KAF9878305.1 hypothetical protein CkaCkLH20_04343 [Colletotrichum karsti]